VPSSCCRRELLAILSALTVIAAEGCAGRLHPAPAPDTSRPARSAGSFVATAYCTGRITAAGTKVNVGTLAADPRVLPLGSVVRVRGFEERYNRTYTVLDTGSKLQGHRIDIYMRSCHEAVRFGRRRVEVMLVRNSA
jgi:3D (Asp-Asp-Asp) domain-containing protein